MLIKIAKFLGISYTWLIDPIVEESTQKVPQYVAEEERKILMQYWQIKNERDREAVQAIIKAFSQE